MTVQYHLNSLQDLTNSCVPNFRNKDNKKKLKPQERLPFPYVLYILLVLQQKFLKKPNTPHIRGIMSSLTL